MTDSPNGAPPMMDLPSTEDIVLSGDTQDIAKNMTQVERDALLVMTFRNTQEIVGFVRQAQLAMDSMQNAPGMMGMMMRNVMPGVGNGNAG